MREDVFQMYLKEMEGIESCDEAENQRLLRAVKSGDKSARDRLIEGNLKMALQWVGGQYGPCVGSGGV